MEVLSLMKRVMIWLYMYPVHEVVSRMQSIKHASFALSIFTIVLIQFVASVIYFSKNVSDNLEQSLYALFQITGILITLFASANVIYVKEKIYKIFNDLEAIYKRFANNDAYQYLLRANNTSEWLCKMYYMYAMGVFCANIISVCAFSVVWTWFANGMIDMDQLFLPYNLSMPWNPKTKIGYFLEVCNSVLLSATVLFPAGTIHLLFTASGLHHRAFYQIFADSAKKLKHPDEDRNDENYIADLIRFHIIAKNWFLETSETYRAFVLIELLCSVLGGACVIFQVDLHLQRVGFDLEVSYLLTQACVAVFYLASYCFVGKMSSDSYANMANELYECQWENLPVRLQNHFILMIQNTQKPIYYTGFGNVVLNLETFCKLIKAVVSYYMIFKTLTLE